jgi:hypothetical protein
LNESCGTAKNTRTSTATSVTTQRMGTTTRRIWPGKRHLVKRPSVGARFSVPPCQPRRNLSLDARLLGYPQLPSVWPITSSVPDAALSSIRSCKNVLTAWATCIVTISCSGISNSLIFGSSCFLSSPFFIGAPTRVLARISCRARCALRTCWSCHWGSRWSSGATGHK